MTSWLSTVPLPGAGPLLIQRAVNGVLSGTALAALSAIFLRAAGRQYSKTRFAVRFATLAAIAALPFLPYMNGLSSAPGNGRALIALPGTWAQIALLIWAAVAAVLLARVGFGLWHMTTLRRNADPVEIQSLDPLLRASLTQFGARRQVQVMKAHGLRVPAAVGLLSPAVLLPDWAFAELSVEELNGVLLHELAHLRRWDDWTNLLQQIVKAIFFFHPAVWWIESKLSLEREMACDEFVLARTNNPRAYAQCLVSLAEKSFLHRGIALALSLLGRVKQTTARVTEILSSNVPVASGRWRTSLAAAALVGIVCAGQASHLPELVAFDKVPGPLASSTHGAYSEISQSREPLAKPTLASYSVPAAPGSHRKPSRLSFAQARKPALLMAQTAPSSDAKAIFAKSSEVQLAEVQPVVFVMQTQELSSAGQMFWRIEIVQLTVFHPVVPPLQRAIPAKQI